MLAIKLSMQAFGPYKKYQTIDFLRLGVPSMFLICGDTGVGKTSIFNAIVFALYGDSIGNQSFRCTHASPEDECFVELVFKHNGQLYRIVRKPEQSLYNAKKDKFVEKKHEVILYKQNESFEDIELLSNSLNDSKEKIKAILGVDVKQFVQISMLVQNKFLELLHSKPNERAELMKAVFDLKKYSAYIERLKQLRDNKDKELKFLIDIIFQSLQRIDMQDSQYDYISFINSQNISDFEAFISEFLLVQNNISLKLKSLHKQHTDLLNQNDIKLKEYAEVSDIILARQKYQKANSEKLEIDRQIDQTTFKLNGLKDMLPKVEKYIQEKENLKLQVLKYPILNNLIKEQKELKNLYQKSYKQKESLEKQYQDIEKNIKEVQEKLSQFDVYSINKNIGQLERMDAYCENCLNQCKRAILKQEEIEENNKKISAFNIDFNMASDSLNTLQNAFAKALIDYKNNLARQLHEELEDGKPCPVCGSCHHEKISFSNHYISINIEEENAKLDKARQKYLNIKSEIDKLKLSNTDKQKDLNIILQELNKILSEETKIKYKNDFLALKQAIEVKKQSVLTQINNEQNNIKIFNSLNAKQEEYRTIKDDSLKTLSVLNINISNYKNKIDLIENQVKQIMLELTYESEFLAEQQIQKLDSIVIDFNNKKQFFEENLNELNVNLATCKTIMEENFSKLYPSRSIDQEKLTEELQLIKLQISEVSNNINCLNNIFTNNQKEYDLSYKNYKEYQKKYEYLKNNLDPLFNVFLINRSKNKLDLSKFVLSTILERIVNKSNVRLDSMTNSRYRIIRGSTKQNKSDVRDASEISLSVYDNLYQSERPIESLSGGESYTAALAFALGLSDEISSNNGGISFDTLFIDEGFGNLDDNYLEQVTSMLERLADSNKNIAIISHVEELKNSIPKKLHIKADPSFGAKCNFELEY